jgi:predicted membrane protein
MCCLSFVGIDICTLFASPFKHVINTIQIVRNTPGFADGLAAIWKILKNVTVDTSEDGLCPGDVGGRRVAHNIGLHVWIVCDAFAYML